MSVLSGSKTNEGACQWPSGAMNSQGSYEEISLLELACDQTRPLFAFLLQAWYNWWPSFYDPDFHI